MDSTVYLIKVLIGMQALLSRPALLNLLICGVVVNQF
jgi:hypothetical protein